MEWPTRGQPGRVDAEAGTLPANIAENRLDVVEGGREHMLGRQPVTH